MFTTTVQGAAGFLPALACLAVVCGILAVVCGVAHWLDSRDWR